MSIDKLALSPVVFSRQSFESTCDIIAEAGFQGISLRYDRLREFFSAGGSLREMKDILRDYGLECAEAAFLSEWQFHGGIPLICQRKRGAESQSPSYALRELHEFFVACSELECENITAVPALWEIGDLQVAADDFARLCDLARPYGLRVGLEFMGVAPQINGITAASELVEAAGRANGGLVIDTFAYHQGGATPAELEALEMGRIFWVQLADAKGLPPEDLNMLRDRLLPGEGLAHIDELIRHLSRNNYCGWYVVEVFNPDYEVMHPNALAKSAYEMTKTIIQNIKKEDT